VLKCGQPAANLLGLSEVVLALVAVECTRELSFGFVDSAGSAEYMGEVAERVIQ
jgi:hypothetical protein